MRGGVAVGAVALLLLGSMAGAVTATVGVGGPPSAVGAAASLDTGASWTDGRAAGTVGSTSQGGTPFRITYELVEPARNDTITVRAALHVPDGAPPDRVEVAVFDSVTTVLDTEGFVRDDDFYRWDGATERPTVTVRSEIGLHTNESDWALVAPDQWLFLQRPARAPVRYGTTGEESRLSVAHDGKLGLYGEPVVTRNTTSGLNVTFVEHRAQPYEPGASQAVRWLVRADRELDIGGRDETLYAVAYPGSDTYIEGLANERSLWVTRDDAGAATVLLHEYVHTRQAFETTDRTAWLREASAEYYGFRESVRQCGTSYEAFRTLTEPGDRYEGYDGRLTDPGNWSTNRVPYNRGTVVLATLDSRIRNATDGERTLADAIRPLNRENVTITHERFQQSVERTANRSFDEFFARYVAGDDLPNYAFSRTPENLGYDDPPCPALADDDGVERTSFAERVLGLLRALVEALLGLLSG